MRTLLSNLAVLGSLALAAWYVAALLVHITKKEPRG